MKRLLGAGIIVVLLALALTPGAVDAALTNATYFKSLIVGGGPSDANGGGQWEDNGLLTTTTIAATDLTVSDDLTVTDDLNVLGDTNLSKILSVYDYSADPDNLLFRVQTNEDTNDGQALSNGSLGVADDLVTPTMFSIFSVEGPLSDTTTNKRPRMWFFDGTDFLDFSLQTGGAAVLEVNSDSGDSTLDIENTTADQVNGTIDGNWAVGGGLQVDTTATFGVAPYTMQIEPSTGLVEISTNDSDVIFGVNASSSDTTLSFSNSGSDQVDLTTDGDLTLGGSQLLVYGTGAGNTAIMLQGAGVSTPTLIQSDPGHGMQINVRDTGANSLLEILNTDGTYVANLDVEGTTYSDDVSMDGLFSTLHAHTTIASGAVTVTASLMILDTEGAAATDDLNTINGGTDGMRVVFMTTNSSRDVVFKNAVDNIRCAADKTIPNTSSTIEFIYRSSSGWKMISEALSN
jgi:hypothetical protein